MKIQLRGAVAGLVALLTLFAMPDRAVYAQGATAQISGTVRDDSGAVLPGVDVTVTQTNTGLVRSTVSDGGGGYVLLNLPIGPYRIEATLQGFRSFQQTGVVLQVGSAPTINIVLGLGALEETVTVQAAAPLVDTQRAGIGEVIENERIEELPLNGRNPTDLIELAGAAVQTTQASTRSFQGTSGGRGIAVAGGQGFGTAYLLDGAMHNNPYDNLNLPLPFPDALQEFRVETGALGAGAGVHSGASVNAVTKSGTNVFRGDLFEFWRNHRFNATSPFAAVIDGERQNDGLNRNQFGGTLGGPVIQNKMFFFGGYQGTYTKQAPVDNIAFVPTAQMLAGDFTTAASAACRAGGNLNLRGPFVGNRVDPSQFSPAALALAQRLPTTTDPCGQVTYGASRNTDENQFVGRVDYQVNNNHTLFGRYIGTSFLTPPALASSDNLLTSAQGGFDNLGHALTLGETWVVSSSTVNAFRFSYNSTYIQRNHEGYFNAADLGINIFSYLDDHFILSVPGAFTVGSGVNNLAIFDTKAFQVSNDLTTIKGNHQIGVGVNISRWTSYNEAHVRSPGSFTINGQVTGLPLSDFLLGNVSQFLQAAPNFLDMYQWYTGFYVNDTWRANPNLTLNYGVRWEPYFPQQLPNEQIYNFSLDRFNQGVKSTVFPNAPAGFLYPGESGFVNGQSGQNKRWQNFAPRVSAAWDPTGEGRTSIRAGYSLGYDFVNAQYHLNTSLAPPWGAEVRLQAVGLDNPYAGFPGGDPFPVTFDANAPFPAFGSFLAVNPDTPNTQQHSWNVAFQQQIGPDMAFSATYIGNHTANLWNMRSLNPGVFLGLDPCTLQTSTGPRFFPVCSVQGNLNQRRVLSLADPTGASSIGFLDQHDTSGRQNYNGLLLSIQRRSVDGISMSANYTLSKCMGHPTTQLPNVGTGWADPDNPDYNYGACESDRRHIVNATVGYLTPQVDGMVGKLVSDWRVNGIFRVQSGAPLTVNTGQDRALNGNVTNQRADVVSDDVYADRDGLNYLNRAAFAQPALGTFGNSLMNGYYGPGRWTLDAVLSRLFRVGTQQFEVRAEAFNLTNNFIRGNPVSNLSNANFGQIQTAGDPRIMQFAVKYSF
ncbi:MAG: TonB-dependent receptor [Acidobacteria bacterium]|nr:TonB-dependent receptor [Acidobacteriota bacterium]